MEGNHGEPRKPKGAKSVEPAVTFKTPEEEIGHLKQIISKMYEDGRSLAERNKVLEAQVSQLSSALNQVNRIGGLMEVVKMSDKFSPEFVEKCVSEIEVFFSEPKETEESDSETKEE